MAKGKLDPSSQQKIHEWQASGKSALAWCKENQIPYTTFMGWKQRFEGSQKRPKPIVQSSKGFIELKDQPLSHSKICSGVSLEYKGDQDSPNQ
jgi:hypothetical protein